MKVYSYLGFARSSGKLISGHTGCEQAIKRRKAKLVVVAADAAETTKKYFSGLSDRMRIPYVIFGNKLDLGKSIGKPGRSVLCILSVPLAAAVEKALSEEVSEVGE